ncbi:4,5-dioxygenase [Sneathiella sp. P13V-1]|nr:4,5-dioxygenase [Sneathiella sp. P13V-1]
MSVIKGYHAHIYFTETNKETALKVREELGQKFAVKLGRVHDQSVGPHTASMYLVMFGIGEFNKLVPWLMLNRSGLSILVHPETGNDIDDHSHHAMWLGEKLDLDLEKL